MGVADLPGFLFILPRSLKVIIWYSGTDNKCECEIELLI
jgi:hypothetical protein